MLFDTHAHYNDEKFDGDRYELLSKMQENNVGLIMNSCSSLEEVPVIFDICKKFPFVYASVGIHPHEVENLKEGDMDTLISLAKNPRVKAIGEIGLDYYYDFSPRDTQQDFFCEQGELAIELELPIIFGER